MYLIKNKGMIMFSYANRQTFVWVFLYELLYHKMFEKKSEKKSTWCCSKILSIFYFFR